MTAATWLPPKMVDAQGNDVVVRSPSGEPVPCRMVGTICYASDIPTYQLVLEVDPEWDREHREEYGDGSSQADAGPADRPASPA